MAGPVFLASRIRSRPTMASDLCCVTLLPRPDRTGKLIAKVKRNKRVTSKRESLDIHETLTERYSREKERTNRRVLADPDEENGGRTSERGERKIDRNPRALEIDFLATSHSHRSDVFRPKFRSRFNSSIPDPRTPIPLHMLLLECLLSLLSSFRLQKSTRTRAYTRIKLTPRFCSSRSKSFNVIAKRSHHFPEKYANLRLQWSLVSTLGDPSTSCLKKRKRGREISRRRVYPQNRGVFSRPSAGFFDLISFQFARVISLDRLARFELRQPVVTRTGKNVVRKRSDALQTLLEIAIPSWCWKCSFLPFDFETRLDGFPGSCFPIIVYT